MSAIFLAKDTGFAPEDWGRDIVPLAGVLAGSGSAGCGIDVTPQDDLAGARGVLLAAPLIRVGFASFADGRGFSVARALRLMGFGGRLRAGAGLIADQYAMARRAGFDEVEVPPALAARQPEAQWLARAEWRSYDHQSQLRG